MINRTLLRIKVVQAIYAYYKSGAGSVDRIEKELNHSLNKTYEMYHLFLILMLDIQRYAEHVQERRKAKHLPTYEDLNPNLKFVNNKFLLQLSENLMLRKYVESTNFIKFDDTVIKELYNLIIETDAYSAYMNAEDHSYLYDKKIWLQIIKQVFYTNEHLGDFLEEKSIYWNDDADVVLSFVSKTIKKFEESNGANQPLLPMFKDYEDSQFAKELLLNAILKAPQYRAIIDQYAKNWDTERLAFMDMVIMQVAMVEICEMTNIPSKVTLNEYIEISKLYSTDKSGIFINGILDRVAREYGEKLGDSDKKSM